MQFTKEDESLEGKMINSIMHLNWISLYMESREDGKEATSI